MPKEYFKLIPAVHLFLIHHNSILLLRRFQTGYEDGNYSVPAGHVDGNETIIAAIIREAKEETGITLIEKDLQFTHCMHRKNGERETVDFFFTSSTWTGDPKNMEENKCDDLSWFPLDQLPSNIIPYIQSALTHHQHHTPFSEFGWN